MSDTVKAEAPQFSREATGVVGPPGSEKTALAKALAALYDVSVLEVGDLLEAKIRDQTPLGKQIRPYKVAGELVPSGR